MTSEAEIAPSPVLPLEPVGRPIWDLISSLGLRLAGVAAAGATTVVLARSLGVRDYGTWAAISAVATLLTQLAEFGTTGPAVVRVNASLSSGAETSSALVAWRLTTGAVLAAAVTLGIALAGSMSIVTAACLLVTVPLSCVLVLAVPDQAAGRGRMQAVLPMLGALCSLAACGLAAVLGRGLEGTAALYALGAAIAALVTVGITNRAWTRVRPSRRLLGQLLRDSWPLAVMGIAVSAYYRLDSVLVYAISGGRQGGLYGVAYRFLDVAQVIPAAVVTPLLARFVVATSTPEERRLTVSRALRVLLSAATVVAVVLIAFGTVICRGLFGAQYADAGFTAGLLSLAFLPISVGWLASTVATGALRTKAMAKWAWMICLLSIAFQLPAIELWGANGAALVTVATELAMGPVILVRTCRAEQIELQYPTLLRPLLCLAAALTLLYLPLAVGVRGGLSVVALIGLLWASRCLRGDDLRLLMTSVRDRAAA